MSKGAYIFAFACQPTIDEVSDRVFKKMQKQGLARFFDIDSEIQTTENMVQIGNWGICNDAYVPHGKVIVDDTLYVGVALYFPQQLSFFEIPIEQGKAFFHSFAESMRIEF